MQPIQWNRIFLFLLTLLITVNLTLILSPQTQGQSQASMNQTAGKDYRKADTKMNTAYKRLMAVLSKEQKTQLKQAQLAWLKFRDAEGTFLASKAQGGSIYPMIHAAHITEITQERTRELTNAYKLFTTEGDM